MDTLTERLEAFLDGLDPRCDWIMMRREQMWLLGLELGECGRLDEIHADGRVIYVHVFDDQQVAFQPGILN